MPLHREPPTPNPSAAWPLLSPTQSFQRGSAPAPQSILPASPAPPIALLPRSAPAPRPSPPQPPPLPGSGGPGTGGWGSEPRGRPVSGGWQRRCQWCRLPRASLAPRRVPARPAAVPLGGRCSASQGGCSRRRIPATPTDGSISTSARPQDARIGPRCANRRMVQPMQRHRSRQSRCPTGPPPSPVKDPGVPAPGHPNSSSPLAVLSTGARTPDPANSQPSPSAFSGNPGALTSRPLDWALGSRIPLPASPCGSA